MEIRETILNELARRGWSRYRLAMECKHAGLPRSTIYRFLQGESTLTSDGVEKLLAVLNLKIIAG